MALPPTFRLAMPALLRPDATRTRAWVGAWAVISPCWLSSRPCTNTPPEVGEITSVATCRLASASAGTSRRRSVLLPAAVTRRR